MACLLHPGGSRQLPGAPRAAKKAEPDEISLSDLVVDEDSDDLSVADLVLSALGESDGDDVRSSGGISLSDLVQDDEEDLPQTRSIFQEDSGYAVYSHEQALDAFIALCIHNDPIGYGVTETVPEPPSSPPPPRAVPKKRPAARAPPVRDTKKARPVTTRAPAIKPVAPAKAGATRRPPELAAAPIAPAGTARAWWLALGIQVTESKKHRNPHIVCGRVPVAEADVLRDVEECWAIAAALPRLPLVRGTDLRSALDRADERILGFVFARAEWDRSADEAAAGKCGARLAVPPLKGGAVHAGELPACAHKAATLRGLCTRCSQLASRLDNAVALVLVTAYALTAPGDTVQACLRSIAAFVHWFCCTATYLNRNYCYAEIQAWTASMVNALVDARPALAAELAGRIAAAGPRAVLRRAPM